MSGVDLRTSLTWHLRSNHYPPLPVEHVDWVMELLPHMKRAEQEARDFGDCSLYDEMVRVPDAVLASGVTPTSGEQRDAGLYVRLGDMVGAMHLHDYLNDGEDEPADSGVGAGEAVIDSWTVDGEKFGHKGWEFRVVLTYDHDSRLDDFDCYSDADEAAWKRDAWMFVDVKVTPVDSMGRVWEQDAVHLGGVEWGALAELSIGREKFNEHPLPDMIAEAMDSVQGRIDGADG